MEESYSVDPLRERQMAVNEGKPVFRVVYSNKYGDIIAFAFYHQMRQPVFVGAIVVFIVVITCLNYSLAPFLTSNSQSSDRVVQFLVFMTLNAILYAILVVLVSVVIVLSMLSRKNRTFLTRHTVTLTERHFVEETEFGTSEFKWTGIEKVCRTKKFVLVYVSQHGAHVVPRRAFETPEDMHEFYVFCRSQFEAARDN